MTPRRAALVLAVEAVTLAAAARLAWWAWWRTAGQERRWAR